MTKQERNKYFKVLWYRVVGVCALILLLTPFVVAVSMVAQMIFKAFWEIKKKISEIKLKRLVKKYKK